MQIMLTNLISLLEASSGGSLLVHPSGESVIVCSDLRIMQANVYAEFSVSIGCCLKCDVTG